MSSLSLDHYIGREVVKMNDDGVTLDGNVRIYNDDQNRDVEQIPTGARLVTTAFDRDETRAIFSDANGAWHTLTLTATKHSLSDPERTSGERVTLQGGEDLRDLSVPPEPSERDSEHPIHVEERQKALDEELEPIGPSPEAGEIDLHEDD